VLAREETAATDSEAELGARASDDIEALGAPPSLTVPIRVAKAEAEAGFGKDIAELGCPDDGFGGLRASVMTGGGVVPEQASPSMRVIYVRGVARVGDDMDRIKPADHDGRRRKGCLPGCERRQTWKDEG
jgi:hypothetical protein